MPNKRELPPESEGPKIEFPNDPQLVESLRNKLQEYEERLETEEEKNKFQPPEVAKSKSADSRYKIAVLKAVLEGGADTHSIARQLEREDGEFYDVRAFENACAVIDSYSKGEASKIQGGTGLKSESPTPSPERQPKVEKEVTSEESPQGATWEEVSSLTGITDASIMEEYEKNTGKRLTPGELGEKKKALVDLYNEARKPETQKALKKLGRLARELEGHLELKALGKEFEKKKNGEVEKIPFNETGELKATDAERAKKELLAFLDRMKEEVTRQKKGDPMLADFLKEFEQEREELVNASPEEVMKKWNEMIAEERAKLEETSEEENNPLTIKLPKGEKGMAIVKKLTAKMEQYRDRVRKSREEFNEFNKSGGSISEKAEAVTTIIDAYCKSLIISEITSKGEVNMNDLAGRLSQEIESLLGVKVETYSGVIQNAYAVIKSYVEEGGKGIVGGGGF